MPRKKSGGVRASAKKRPGPKPGNARGTGGAQAAISGLTGYRNQLIAQRNDVDKRISAIENALAAMGSTAVRAEGFGPGRGRHGPRKGSLKEYIANVISARGDVMAVRDITTGVLELGYKTRNKTLAKSVGIALTEMPNIRKVDRGRFCLSGANDGG